MLPLYDIHLTPESVRERFHFRFNSNKYASEYDRWVFGKKTCESWAEKGRILKTYADPSDSLAAKGALGYYSGLYIYDQGGLVNRDVVSAQFDKHHLKSPGHDKMAPLEFFFDKQPTLILPAILTKPQLMRKVMEYKSGSFSSLYVADFMPVTETTTKDESKVSRYFLVLKRIEEGTPPQSAWDKVKALLSGL